jgi:putative phage-type endonuclease
MKYISTIDMSREDWIAIRQASIGTSDFAAALGYSPWKTPVELWDEKMNGAEDIQSFRFEQGHWYEQVVRKWFTEKTGLKVKRDRKIRIHKDYEYLTTNLDGIVVRNDGKKSGIEIKTVDPMIYRHWHGQIPLYYQIQAQGQMAITGLDSVFFAVQIGFSDYKIEEHEFDGEWWDIILPKLVDYWESYVVEKKPPPPVNSEDIVKLFPDSNGDVLMVDENEEIQRVVKDLLYTKTKIKQLQEDQKQFEFMIKEFIGEADGMKDLSDRWNITYKTGKPRKSFDKKSFGAKHPDLLDKYTKEGNGFRTFRITEVTP